MSAPLFLHSQTDGSTDYTFANGMITEDAGSYESPHEMVVQPDGKLLAGTWSYDVNTDNTDIVLFRYNTDGTRDNSFGTGGKAVFTPDAGGIKEVNIAVEPGGKIYVATSQQYADGPLYLLRLNSNGTPDNTFGVNGTLVDSVNAYGQHVDEMIVQHDGKIVMGGYYWITTPANRTNSYVLRYNTNGTRDNTFGANGFKVIDLVGMETGGVGESSRLRKMIQQPDGKLLLAGSQRNPGQQTSDWGICRLLPNGTPDSTFEMDGALIMGMQYNESITGLGLQNDGSIVAAGGCGNGFLEFRIFRITPSGTMDTIFGEEADGYGWGYTSLVYQNFTDHGVSGLYVFPDDKIVAAGGVGAATGIVVRYEADGDYDATFGDNGIVDTVPPPPSGFTISCMTADTVSNRIYIAGFYRNQDTGEDVIWIKALRNGPAGPMGTGEEEQSGKFSVWPNPAQSFINVSGENLQRTEIYDLSGKLVHSTSGSYPQQISTDGLAPGVYLIRGYTAGSVTVRKFIRK